MNIEDLILERRAATLSPEISDHRSSIDIEVAEDLVARIRPTDQPSTYEIRVGVLVDGLLVDEGDPFEASFGHCFDEAVAALRR